MRGDKFCSTLMKCPVCCAESMELCGVNQPGDIPVHIERARQSRWLQMYVESNASKFPLTNDCELEEVQ